MMSRPYTVVVLAMVFVGCSAGTGSILADAGASDAGEGGVDAAPVVPPQVVVGTKNHVACAIRPDRTLACWGSNTEGELGANDPDGGVNKGYANPPREIPAVTGLSQVAIGRTHVCALVGGAVWCWGSSYDLAGDPTVVGKTYVPPHAVPGITGATAIAAGATHTCAVVSSGAVKCWGTCETGVSCLGAGVSSGMTDVSGLTGVTQLSAGWDSTCALTGSGAVYCWGRDDLGQGGDGPPFMHIDKPVPVQGLQSNVKAIGHGYEFVCALSTDATVSCWGSSSLYMLGNGSQTPSAVPLKVAGVQGVVHMTVGHASVCVTDAGSNVKCWGTNLTAMLSPQKTNFPTPQGFGVPVDPFTDLQLGTGEACAVLTTGGIRCWGYGALGDGVTTDSIDPVKVIGFE